MSSVWRSIMGFFLVILGLGLFVGVISLLGAVIFSAI